MEKVVMVKIVSGGGIAGNKVVQSRAGVKVEPKAKAINPASAGQLGASTQFVKPPLVSGRGYEPGPKGSTGLSGTYNPAREGPGSGRTTYRSGSQGATPQANEMPEGRNTLSEYGRDIPGRK
jgi:hypothetical protein